MISDYFTLATVVAVLLLVALMFFVRHPVHRLILQLTQSSHGLLRVAAKACVSAAHRVRLRNYELTRVLAETIKERQLERRFRRVEKQVERDLAHYEIIAADINQHLAVLDEDYKASAQVPRISMEWVAAVEAVASLKEDQRNSEAVSKILQDMHSTVKRHHTDLLREHRWVVATRHKLLSGLQGHWRKLGRKLDTLDDSIAALRQRLYRVDQHMEQFEMMTRDSSQGFIASMLMRFVLSLICVMGGTAVALINLELLQVPLQQSLTVSVYENLPLPLLLAALHLAMTLMAAAMVLESQRITNFFPLVGAMSERTRTLLFGTGLLILGLLMVMEALAMFFLPAATNTEMVASSRWLLSGLGLIMPVIISLAMVPLEYFLYTVRPVLGTALQVLLHAAAWVLRMTGYMVQQAGKLLVKAYDVIIFLPLLAEERWQKQQMTKAADAAIEQSTQPAVPSESLPLAELPYRIETAKNQRH